MPRLLLPFTPRFISFTLAVTATLAIIIVMATTGASGVWWLGLAAAGGLSALGVHDLLQERHAVLRNYPIAAHLRFILEEIRPEMRQYFFEGEKDERPFSRDRRAIVYQRAKKAPDKRPFGTQHDVYANGYEWVRHSIGAKRGAGRRFPRHGWRSGLREALFGLRFQHLGDELWRAQRQRHPGAEQGRGDGRLRARYGRGRI